MNSSQQNKQEPRQQFVYPQAMYPPGCLQSAPQQFYFFQPNQSFCPYNPNIDYHRVRPSVYQQNGSYSKSNEHHQIGSNNLREKLLQSFGESTPENKGDGPTIEQVKTQSDELRDRLFQRAEITSADDQTKIRKLFVNTISALALPSMNEGFEDEVSDDEDEHPIEDPETCKNAENGQTNHKTDGTQLSIKEVQVESNALEETPEIKETVSHLKSKPSDIKLNDGVNKSENNDLASSTSVSKIVSSRISYSFGDLLEYHESKDSMTLKSLNAIDKYIVRSSNIQPKRGLVQYKRSENSFISHKDRISNLTDTQASIERFKIAVRTCLNKLTAQNISMVHDELTKLKFDNQDLINCLSESLVRSVTKNILLISNYAHLTTKLIEFLGKTDEKSSKMLKQRISERCLKNLVVDQEWLKSYNVLKSRKISTLAEHDILNEELLETEETQRKVHIGTITFLANLLKLGVFDNTDIALNVLNILNSDLHEYVIEMLCKYLTLFGSELEKKFKKEIVEVFKRIEDIKPDCPRRLQFLLEDVIALRNEHWRVTGSEFQTNKITFLKTTENFNCTPQRATTNKPSISHYNSASQYSKGDKKRHNTGYFTHGNPPRATKQENKFRGLASDVNDPSDVPSFSSNRQPIFSQKRGSQNQNNTHRIMKTATGKPHIISDENSMHHASFSSDAPQTTVASPCNVEDLKKELEILVCGYFVSLDVIVILGGITNIDIQYMDIFVEVSFLAFVEKRTYGHRFLGDLLVILFMKKRMDKSSFLKGFHNFCLYVKDFDLEIDVPKLWNFVSCSISPLICSGDLSICEYMEIIISSGNSQPDSIMSELMRIIVHTTSKLTLYFLCKNVSFLKLYEKYEKVREEFPYLTCQVEELGCGVALPQIFLPPIVSEGYPPAYKFEDGNVNLDALGDFSRIVYSKCPPGPIELVKSYIDELCPILERASFGSLDLGQVSHFLTILGACVEEQNKSPSCFVPELIKEIIKFKLIDESWKDQILSIQVVRNLVR